MSIILYENPKFKIGDKVFNKRNKEIDVIECMEVLSNSKSLHYVLKKSRLSLKEDYLEFVGDKICSDNDYKLGPNNTKDFMAIYGKLCTYYQFSCELCPIGACNNGVNKVCREFITNNTEEAIELMQKWLDEHPEVTKPHVKTIKEDLLEKFPNTKLVNGFPSFCPYEVGYTKESNCLEYGGCKECWDQPYKWEDGDN